MLSWMPAERFNLTPEGCPPCGAIVFDRVRQYERASQGPISRAVGLEPLALGSLC